MRLQQKWVWLLSLAAWGGLVVVQTASWKNSGVIDALAAATNKNPTMTVTGVPIIVNNVISAVEGQPVVINVQDIDQGVQNYPGAIQTGTFDKAGRFYTSSNPSFPPGASFTQSRDGISGIFNWTPPVGFAAQSSTVSIIFGVINQYWNTYSKRTISIQIAGATGTTSSTPIVPVATPVVRKIHIARARQRPDGSLDIAGDVVPMKGHKVKGLSVLLHDSSSGDLIATATVKGATAVNGGKVWNFKGMAVDGKSHCAVQAELSGVSLTKPIQYATCQ